MKQYVLQYITLFEPAEEGGYTVTVPKLPGLVTEGDTFEEAVSMVKDAIKGYLDVLKESGESIPAPDEDVISLSVSIPYSSAYDKQSFIQA